MEDLHYFCCGKCRGLLTSRVALRNHRPSCSGGSEASDCSLFACERTKYLLCLKLSQCGVDDITVNQIDGVEEIETISPISKPLEADKVQNIVSEESCTSLRRSGRKRKDKYADSDIWEGTPYKKSKKGIFTSETNTHRTHNHEESLKFDCNKLPNGKGTRSVAVGRGRVRKLCTPEDEKNPAIVKTTGLIPRKKGSGSKPVKQNKAKLPEVSSSKIDNVVNSTTSFDKDHVCNNAPSFVSFNKDHVGNKVQKNVQTLFVKIKKCKNKSLKGSVSDKSDVNHTVPELYTHAHETDSLSEKHTESGVGNSGNCPVLDQDGSDNESAPVTDVGDPGIQRPLRDKEFECVTRNKGANSSSKFKLKNARGSTSNKCNKSSENSRIDVGLECKKHTIDMGNQPSCNIEMKNSNAFINAKKEALKDGVHLSEDSVNEHDKSQCDSHLHDSNNVSPGILYHSPKLKTKILVKFPEDYTKGSYDNKHGKRAQPVHTDEGVENDAGVQTVQPGANEVNAPNEVFSSNRYGVHNTTNSSDKDSVDIPSTSDVIRAVEPMLHSLAGEPNSLKVKPTESDVGITGNCPIMDQDGSDNESAPVTDDGDLGTQRPLHDKESDSVTRNKGANSGSKFKLHCTQGGASSPNEVEGVLRSSKVIRNSGIDVGQECISTNKRPSCDINMEHTYAFRNINKEVLEEGVHAGETEVEGSIDGDALEERGKSQCDNMNSQTKHSKSQSDDMNSQTKHSKSQCDNMNSQTKHSKSQSDDMNSQAKHSKSQYDDMNSQTKHSKSQCDDMNSQTKHDKSQCDMNSQSPVKRNVNPGVLYHCPKLNTKILVKYPENSTKDSDASKHAKRAKHDCIARDIQKNRTASKPTKVQVGEKQKRLDSYEFQLVVEDGHATKLYSCSICNKFSSKQIGLFDRHMQYRHNAGRLWECDMCEYSCENRAQMKKHVNQHTRPYMCEYCPFKCAELKDLQRHVWTHTGEFPLKCPNCDYKCRQRKTLREHMRKHTGERLMCGVVGCSFSTCHQWTLNNHWANKHSTKKRFRCDRCTYATSDRGSYNKHIKLHLGLKQFKCSICDFHGVTKYDVLRHMRVHTKEKKYFCDRCEYSTSYSSGLKLHMMSHLGIKPWQCSICGYNSITRQRVLRHLLQRHPNVSESHVVNLGFKLQLQMKNYKKPEGKPKQPNMEYKVEWINEDSDVGRHMEPSKDELDDVELDEGTGLVQTTVSGIHVNNAVSLPSTSQISENVTISVSEQAYPGTDILMTSGEESVEESVIDTTTSTHAMMVDGQIIEVPEMVVIEGASLSDMLLLQEQMAPGSEMVVVKQESSVGDDMVVVEDQVGVTDDMVVVEQPADESENVVIVPQTYTITDDMVVLETPQTGEGSETESVTQIVLQTMDN